MRFSEARGHKVVSTSSAATVGLVDGFVVDPRTRSVLALRLKKSKSGDSLRWSDLTAFGNDAATVAGEDLVTEPDDTVKSLSGKDSEVLGKRVLSSAGDELGAVADVDFDPETGGLTTLVLDHGEVAADRLLNVGSYAVVVRAE